MAPKPIPPASRLVLGYARVSTDQQADRGISLDAQQARIRALATVHELDIGETFIDSASASSLRRPELARLLAAVDAGRVRTVIVAKLDRLTRSVRDLADLLDRFERHDVALLSVAESLDTRSAAGRLVLNVMVSVGQWEREAIGERTREALRYKRGRGERTGNLPFGFALAADGVHLVPHRDERRTLALARKLRAAGLRLDDIADRLNKIGFRTRSGGAFHKMAVSRMLRERPQARARAA